MSARIIQQRARAMEATLLDVIARGTLPQESKCKRHSATELVNPPNRRCLHVGINMYSYCLRYCLLTASDKVAAAKLSRRGGVGAANYKTRRRGC